MRVSGPPSPQSLGRLAFFQGATDEALARLLFAARSIDVLPGETIIDFDDETTEVFFVLQGALRALVRTADGNSTQILGDLLQGDLVGELSAIDASPRSARVEALVVSRLCVVPAAAFLEMVFASPPVGLRLMRHLTARLRSQTYRLLEHAVLPTRMRLAAELLRMARPRKDGTQVLTPPPTQEELASRIGTRRETVSRELAVLVRTGHLRHDRSAIVLCAPDRLRAMVEDGLEQHNTNRRRSSFRTGGH